MEGGHSCVGPLLLDYGIYKFEKLTTSPVAEYIVAKLFTYLVDLGAIASSSKALATWSGLVSDCLVITCTNVGIYKCTSFIMCILPYYLQL